MSQAAGLCVATALALTALPNLADALARPSHEAAPARSQRLAARVARPHNLIIFVADGLRSGIVTPQTAPTMAALRSRGVDFRNSHSIYPTLTTANASAFATGHLLGDTGDFANSIYVAFPVTAAGGSSTPFLENDEVLGELNQHFDGDYLDETSVLEAANASGLATASIGKLGPVAIQAVTARTGNGTIVVDDRTGNSGGIPLSGELRAAVAGAGLPTQAPGRGANGNSGDAATPGTLVPNVEQQQWFVRVATDVVLPRFRREGRPFAMVFWSRDPDGTQHNQGDSLNRLTPGINGPTSLAAIRNADTNLAALMTALQRLGLESSTDIIVVADHGFSTISKQSATSRAGRFAYPDVPAGFLPPGFLAIDLAAVLNELLVDADTHRPVDYGNGAHPRQGNGLIGRDSSHPRAIVAANGGSDLIYLPGGDAPGLARRIVAFLTTQDYASSIFVADRLGPIPGTLPLSLIGLDGHARTPQPDIVVGFASHATGCANDELCAAEIADTSLQQGQGMHGSFSRADTHNFMAATGPDFRPHFVDPAPASNADIGMTAAHLLHLDVPRRGTLVGRVLSEALAGGHMISSARRHTRSRPAANGHVTRLDWQVVGRTAYFDVAGVPGRSVGMAPRSPARGRPRPRRSVP